MLAGLGVAVRAVMRGVAAYGEVLLCETAQAGPGVQFFAEITFCFLSDLCIFAGPSFPSSRDKHTRRMLQRKEES